MTREWFPLNKYSFENVLQPAPWEDLFPATVFQQNWLVIPQLKLKLTELEGWDWHVRSFSLFRTRSLSLTADGEQQEFLSCKCVCLITLFNTLGII